MMKRMAKRPFWITLTTLLVVSAYVMYLQGVTLAAVEEIDGNSIRQISPLLSGKPAGFGLPIGERSACDDLVRNDSFKRIITEAEKLL